jgi:imidazolonepropionase-like amidohydrolase
MALAVLCIHLLLASALTAQRPERRGQGRRFPTRKTTPTAKPKEGAAKKKGPITAIVGADIYTVSREVIRRGVVLVQDGKILDVGQDVKVPSGAKVIDAKGKYISPGFITMNMTRIGLSSRSSSGKVSDGLDPFDRNIKFALGVGITTGCVQVGGSGRRRRRRLPEDRFLGLDPEIGLKQLPFNIDFGDPNATSVCPCCGLPILPTEPIVPTRPTTSTQRKHLVLKMTYGKLKNMLVMETPAYGMSASSLAGPLNRHNWRQTIGKAKRYLKAKEEYDKQVKAGKKVTAPRNTIAKDVLRLVKKEIYLRTEADSVDEIRDMIALAKELDYKLMLDNVAEGWLTAEELSEAKVPVVIIPRRLRAPSVGRENETGSSIETPGILEKAGVRFAVAPLSSSISLNGLAGRDLTSLPLEAAFAVRGGASEKAALAALTIVPAQMLGLEDRIGSIDKGKDADLLILNGPPLDYRTYVETAMVNGRVVYERAKDRIYPVFER